MWANTDVYHLRYSWNFQKSQEGKIPESWEQTPVFTSVYCLRNSCNAIKKLEGRAHTRLASFLDAPHFDETDQTKITGGRSSDMTSEVSQGLLFRALRSLPSHPQNLGVKNFGAQCHDPLHLTVRSWSSNSMILKPWLIQMAHHKETMLSSELRTSRLSILNGVQCHRSMVRHPYQPGFWIEFPYWEGFEGEE